MMIKLETMKNSITNAVKPVSVVKELKCRLQAAITGLNCILAQPTVNGKITTKAMKIHSEARKTADRRGVKMVL